MKKKKSKLYTYLLRNLVAAENGAAKALDISTSFWFYGTAAPIGKRNTGKLSKEPEIIVV